jgi:hypothetical protein
MRQKFALYRSLKGKLTAFLPLAESQLHNLIWFIIGLCCAGDVRLPKLATEIPYTLKCESLVQRLWRFLKNTRVLPKTVYHVVAKQFLTCWQGRQLHLIIDRMPLKHHSLFCIALSFRRRAIPLVWEILPKKGATNFRQQSALIRECLLLIPETCDVILLGDREFRSIALMRFLKRHNWHFRLRLKKDTWVRINRRWIQLGNLPLEKGQRIYFTKVYVTKKRYGPVNLAVYWKKGEKQPWYIATDEEACATTLLDFAKRMHIEEMFSDFQSRGFNMQKSKIKTPERMDRLMLVVAMAYLYLVQFGHRTVKRGLRFIFAKRNGDLSLFTLGFRAFKRESNQDKRIHYSLNFSP